MNDGDCGHSGITFNWTDPVSVNACGNYVRSLAQKLLVAPNAIFLDSCKHHCGEWNAITIDQIRSPVALQIWYEQGAKALPGGTGYIDQNQPFPCDSCCSSRK